MKNKIIKNWKKWILIGLSVLTLMIGSKFYKNQKAQAKNRYLMEKQRELMMGMWAEDGLTEEEMAERMLIMREKREELGGDEAKDDMGVMRMGRLMH